MAASRLKSRRVLAGLGTAMILLIGVLLWDLLWEPATPPQPMEPDSSTVSQWSIYHANHLGSILLVTNVEGQVTEAQGYSPYGEILNASHSTPEASRFKYTDQEWEEAKLYYFGARYYDPTLSRFVSIDPIDRYPRDPYSYTQNNPISYFDPEGKQRLHLED
jgi:RHS repeat-associated protein